MKAIGKINVKGIVLAVLVKKGLIWCQMFHEVKTSIVTGQIWTKRFPLGH